MKVWKPAYISPHACFIRWISVKRCICCHGHVRKCQLISDMANTSTHKPGTTDNSAAGCHRNVLLHKRLFSLLPWVRHLWFFNSLCLKETCKPTHTEWLHQRGGKTSETVPTFRKCREYVSWVLVCKCLVHCKVATANICTKSWNKSCLDIKICPLWLYATPTFFKIMIMLFLEGGDQQWEDKSD